jgi:hypothetical protein
MINSKKIEDYLPKWTGMICIGDKLTSEQALEIIIRTDRYNFYNEYYNEYYNDVQLINVIKKTYLRCLPVEDQISDQTLDIEKFNHMFGILPIYYLNNHMLYHSTGLHGWMKKDGTVKTSSYNIGKRPTKQDLIEEVQIILKAFPFIKNIHFQFLNGEINNPIRKVIFSIRVVEREIILNFNDEDILLQSDENDFEQNYLTETNHLNMVKKGLLYCYHKLHGVLDE